MLNRSTYFIYSDSTHFHKREIVRHRGPSSGSKDKKGGEVEDDGTSNSSSDEYQIDSDYVDTKETGKAKVKQRMTTRLRPQAEKKK